MFIIARSIGHQRNSETAFIRYGNGDNLKQSRCQTLPGCMTKAPVKTIRCMTDKIGDDQCRMHIIIEGGIKVKKSAAVTRPNSRGNHVLQLRICPPYLFFLMLMT